MRKSRFVLNLIAATAIGLSVFGCEGSDSGAIADTSDIAIGSGGNQAANERRNLREYLLIGQRGLSDPGAPTFLAGQDSPSVTPGPVVAGQFRDDVIDDARALLYELVGIADQPLPSANILGPGSTGADTEDPTSPVVGGAIPNAGTTGFHEVLADPGGRYAIGISRAKNRGLAGDSTVQNTQVQIFGMDIEESLETRFPPVLLWGTVADRTPIQVFPANQGLFVSGAWSPNGLSFYLGIDRAIRTYTVDRAIGRLTGVQEVAFPAGGVGINNPMKLLATADNRFLFAIDNANGQILRFARNATTGVLTSLGAATTTVTDPRGATIDRTGNFMYVVGRGSGQLAAYRIETDGSLTQVQVFAGLGATTANFGRPIGDIDANPAADQLFIATYAGVLGGYNINPATGELTATGVARPVLAGARNTANIEVEPTGRFVIAAQEADFEELQNFVTVANGFPVPEDPIFANLVAITNDTAAGTYSLTPQLDANGRTVFVLPQTSTNAFRGSVEAFRIESDGSVRVESRVAAVNPYGLDFFQRVLVPPVPISATATPIVP